MSTKKQAERRRKAQGFNTETLQTIHSFNVASISQKKKPSLPSTVSSASRKSEKSARRNTERRISNFPSVQNFDKAGKADKRHSPLPGKFKHKISFYWPHLLAPA
jgi:hypothetical protein